MKKSVLIIIAGVVALGVSLYRSFRSEPVPDDERQVKVDAALAERAEHISLELRKMAESRSLWKIARFNIDRNNVYFESSIVNLRRFSKEGWHVESVMTTKKVPGVYNCSIVNDEGQKGTMVLCSPDQGKHWGLYCFSFI